MVDTGATWWNVLGKRVEGSHRWGCNYEEWVTEVGRPGVKCAIMSGGVSLLRISLTGARTRQLE